jgi:hypothetical protein
MGGWDPKRGFEGPLAELFENMWAFYPRLTSTVAIQEWLLQRSRLDGELYICRRYGQHLRGAWDDGQGANPFLTSDNEFATSIFGLALLEDVSPLTRGSLKDALSLRGVKLCWAFGETTEEEQQVIATHVKGGIATPPTGGTRLYRFRSAKKLKLAHLAPAAEQVSVIPLSHGDGTRLRMLRSINPINMYPLPQAGGVFTHQAERAGKALPLKRKDLGETTAILECALAFLEERYRDSGFGAQFDLYREEAMLAAVDLSAARKCSREITVRVSLNEEGCAASEDVKTYDEFKEWARDIVKKYGHPHAELFVTGREARGSDPAPVLSFVLTEFDDEYEGYNCVYGVAGDTRVSALTYFLLLDERFDGDLHAIFRPGRSKNGRGPRLKPLLAFDRNDFGAGRIAHLGLHGGEVKGWNVLSRE